MSRFVIGIDIGGSGSRAALGAVAADQEAPRTCPRVLDTFIGPRLEVGSGGSTVLDVVRGLVDSAATAWAAHLPEVMGIGIGASGIASLSDGPAEVPAEISADFDIPAVAAIDAVTAHLGALDGRGGAITVLGTGAIAIGHPGPGEHGHWAADWSRVDGWGHLFGDRGGGAWLGRLGLELALRAHDGVDDCGSVLLEAAIRRFGLPDSWPGLFYTRSDRAGLLAEFATDIAEAARTGDAASAQLLDGAGREAARSALAAARPALLRSVESAGAAAVRIALTGGLAAAGGHLVEGFGAESSRLRPDAAIVDPAGGPLDGALMLAHLGAGGKLSAQERVLWI